LPIIVNDLNPSMVALWRAVREYPGELIALLRDFTPTLESFREFRAFLRDINAVPANPRELVEIAFRRLVNQATSHSGFLDGGPRGGNAQIRHTLASKWNPRHLSGIIQVCSGRMAYAKSLTIRHGGFAEVIADRPHRAALFCDPPYLLNHLSWPQRYYVRHGFAEPDHV